MMMETEKNEVDKERERWRGKRKEGRKEGRRIKQNKNNRDKFAVEEMSVWKKNVPYLNAYNTYHGEKKRDVAFCNNEFEAERGDSGSRTEGGKKEILCWKQKKNEKEKEESPFT